MDRDSIKELGIDSEGRLYLVPESKTFPYIYREAMEVHWDSKLGRLYGAVPRKWTYEEWYTQIVSAAHEQSCILFLSKSTAWANVPDSLKASIQGGVPNDT